MAACAPFAAWWGRMDVEGLEALPRSGPVLVAGNHDSNMDPIAVGVAARRHRQVRALAKSSLWDVRGLGPILDGMGQIPIERGTGDRGALDRAIAALREGACIGVFPEGTRSKGRELRARSGIGHLAAAVPEMPDRARRGLRHDRLRAVSEAPAGERALQPPRRGRLPPGRGPHGLRGPPGRRAPRRRPAHGRRASPHGRVQ